MGANYGTEFEGVDSLRVRSFVNQIGQIPSPVARGIGYTILPRSGVLAFPNRDQVTVAEYAVTNRLDLHLIALRGRQEGSRTQKLAKIIRSEAKKLG